MTFYICIFAFIANASSFFEHHYGLTSTNASYIAGLLNPSFSFSSFSSPLLPSFSFSSSLSSLLLTPSPSLSPLSLSPGTAYYMAIPGSPLMGKLLDMVGKRPIGLVIGTALTIPTFLLFSFSDVTPIVGMVVLGLLNLYLLFLFFELLFCYFLKQFPSFSPSPPLLSFRFRLCDYCWFIVALCSSFG